MDEIQDAAGTPLHVGDRVRLTSSPELAGHPDVGRIGTVRSIGDDGFAMIHWADGLRWWVLGKWLTAAPDAI